MYIRNDVSRGVQTKGEIVMKTKNTGRLVVALFLAGFVLSLLCGAAFAADGKYTIGMIIRDPSAPFQVAMVKGAEDGAKDQGVDIVVQAGKGDTMQILNIIDNYITQQIDAFILAGAVDLRGLVPGIKKLNEAGIPVAALDTSPEGGKVDFFLSFDIEKASAKAAKAFVEGIRERNGGDVPEGVVIEITGDQADMFTHACSDGFNSVIGQYPQLTVAQGEGKWNNTDSHNKVTDLLTRYGEDVLGIYVQTPDIMGAGAVTAIEAAGLDPADYGICGICIGPEGIELIKQGKLLAVVEQPAYDSAVLAVKYLVDKLDGKPVPQIGDTIVAEGELWSPADVIENPWADEGVFISFQGPLVPQEVGVDDPRLWENKIFD
jgi:ribose transport system substrate-binding protein